MDISKREVWQKRSVAKEKCGKREVWQKRSVAKRRWEIELRESVSEKLL